MASHQSSKNHLSKGQWIEIAAFAALAAALAYLLSRNRAPASADASPQTEGAEPSYSAPSSLTPIGLPPISLPGVPGNTGPCACGCAAGSGDPTINDIVNNTNAALASMQQMEVTTLNYIAETGDEQPNLLSFSTQAVS